MKKAALRNVPAVILCILIILPSLFSGCSVGADAELKTEQTANIVVMTSAGFVAPADSLSSYSVTIDVNPSIELKVVEGLVIEGIAYNDDGQSLLLGIDIVGRSASDAVDIIIKALYDNGYLANREMKPTLIVTVANGYMVTEKVAEELEKRAENALESMNVDCDVKSAYISNKTAATAASYGLSAGRYMLLNYIAQAEGIAIEQAIEKYAGVKIGELMDMFKGAKSVFREDTADEDWEGFLAGLAPEQQALLLPALQNFMQEIRAAKEAFHMAFQGIKAAYGNKLEELRNQYGNARTNVFKDAIRQMKNSMLTERREALRVRKDAVHAARAKFMEAVAAAGIPLETLGAYLDDFAGNELTDDGDLDGFLQKFMAEGGEDESANEGAENNINGKDGDKGGDKGENEDGNKGKAKNESEDGDENDDGGKDGKGVGIGRDKNKHNG
ncbi:MAG: anti-sigma-I factor RsgI family protein [Christensenellales bacterium]